MTSTLLVGIFQPSLGGYSSEDVGPRPWLGMVWGNSRLPTDPIGTFTLTLTNLVVGSAIRIEEADGTLREFRTADATSEVFSLAAYSSGSAKNSLVIKVRKGTSAPKYQPFQTAATASVGSQSVYIAQVADPIA